MSEHIEQWLVALLQPVEKSNIDGAERKSHTSSEHDEHGKPDESNAAAKMPPTDPHRWERDAEFIDHLDDAGRRELFERFAAVDDPKQLNSSGVNAGLRRLVAGMANRAEATDGTINEDDREFDEALERLYVQWKDTSIQRHWLLACLAHAKRPHAWKSVAELLISDPPEDGREAIEVMIPFWRASQGPFQSLFPRLLDALVQPVVAPLVLDLANFSFRSQRIQPHPAADRLPQLTSLLGQLVERLEGFEQQSQQRGVDNLDVARQVTESVALATSLCDTLALNDHQAASGKLYRMMELRHRRLRIEAAAALARFGEEAGIDALVEAAAEPLVRLRAIEYARELELEDRIDKEHRSPLAVAEAELVVRLAEPDLYGIPPLSCELVDQTTLHWPGYDEPRDCFLFRFRYQFAQGEFENFGIAGPVSHAFAADLTKLQIADVYGVFAGWHVEHPELQRFVVEPETNLAGSTVSKLVEFLGSQGYEGLTPAFGASFFEDEFLIASATRDGVAGIAIGNQTSARWIPNEQNSRPLDPDTAYSMVLGRELLNRFNPGFDEYDGEAT